MKKLQEAEGAMGDAGEALSRMIWAKRATRKAAQSKICVRERAAWPSR